MFKVGDKVRRIRQDFESPDGKSFKVGCVGTVTAVCESSKWISVDGIRNYYDNLPMDSQYFELVEDKKMFDLKTMPWYIKVKDEKEFNSIRQWLIENGVLVNFNYHVHMATITHGGPHCKVGHAGWAMYESTCQEFAKEIKLTFKTVVDNVNYPVVESAKDKEIREVREEMQKLAERLKKLEGE